MLIGLTQRIVYYKGRPHDALEHGWHALLKGHSLSLVPNTLNQDFDELAQSLDSMIITGGDDSPQRRTVELKLATAMLKANKPILGICHGAFLLTEVLGGQLGHVEHHMDVPHSVRLQNDSYKVVNSFHTNGILTPHSTAQVLAVDIHERCEAWVDGYIAGVVWHPERMDTPWVPVEIANKFFI